MAIQFNVLILLAILCTESFLFDFSYHVRRASNFRITNHRWDEKINAVIVSLLRRKDKCCHCAVDKTKRDKDLLKIFRVFLPICAECKEKGLLVMKRNPFKREPFHIINIIYIALIYLNM